MSPSTKTAARIGFAFAAVAALPAVTAPSANATADGSAQELQTSPPCANFVAEYALAARLRLTDTPFGAGDGVYDIGPGLARLRFSRTVDPKASKVELLGYEMRDQFTVESRVLFIRATVTTSTLTRATPDASGAAAVGTLRGKELGWATPVRGYRTDGTIHCEGSGCGLGGAPPSGTSPLHIGPGPVRFDSFVFDSPDLETFRMAWTRVSHTDMPKQTAYVALAGRRTTRECLDK